MSYSKIAYTVADGVALIELNDPPANTYSYDMMREIDDAVLSARMDEGVHVILLIGAGEKFFCAGANIGMLKEATPVFKYYFCLHANETMNRLEQTPKLECKMLNSKFEKKNVARFRPKSFLNFAFFISNSGCQCLFQQPAIY